MRVFQQDNYPPMGLILHHFLYSLNIMEKREGYTAFGHKDRAYSVNWYTDLLGG